MTGPGSAVFLWVDERGKKIKCSAPQYIGLDDMFRLRYGALPAACDGTRCIPDKIRTEFFFRISNDNNENAQIIMACSLKRRFWDPKGNFYKRLQMNANPETQHKVLILGNQEVGKTAIVNSWARGVKPNRAYRPTVFNTIPKSVQFDGRSIQLEITDTGGLDEYSFFPKSYGDVEVSAYEAFVIVYAINKKDSLLVADSIKTKLEKQRGCKFIESHGKPTPLLLVANKTDLESERIISTAKGRELAKKWQLPDDAFLEVSATDTDQIKCLFNNIIRMLDEANREPEEQRRCSIM